MEEKNLHEETVTEAEVAEMAEDPTDEGFHKVDGEGHVYGRASGDYDEDSEVDYLNVNPPTKLDEPQKDERAAAPMQADALSPSTVQVPDRHEHTAHDEEGRDKTVDDADFDADEKGQDANG